MPKAFGLKEISVFDPFDEEMLYYVKQLLVHAHSAIHKIGTLNSVEFSRR